MSWPLFKYLIKKNWKIWAIFAFIMLLYLSVLLVAFTPELIKVMQGFYPGIADDDIIIFISSMYIPSIATMFPMIFYIFMAHKLVNKTVDDTSLSAHLSASISRKKYIATAGAFLILSIVSLFSLTLLNGAILMPIFSKSFIFTRWLNLIVLQMLASLSVAFISFFFSSVLAGKKFCLVLIIGIPVLLMLFGMIAGAVEAIGFLTHIPPFYWFDAGEVARGVCNTWWWLDIIYVAIISILFFISIKVFEKKQLSI